MIDDIKILPITFDMKYSNLNIQLDKNTHTVIHLPNIKIVPKYYQLFTIIRNK